jgi:hypothetical protein
MYYISHLSICLPVCLSVCLSVRLYVCLSMALQPFVWPLPLCNFLILYTVGKTPWTGGSARHKAATCTHDSTDTEKTHTDIHASGGIRTHDPSVWAGEDSSCLRPSGHCDRHIVVSYYATYKIDNVLLRACPPIITPKRRVLERFDKDKIYNTIFQSVNTTYHHKWQLVSLLLWWLFIIQHVSTYIRSSSGIIWDYKGCTAIKYYNYLS